MEEESNVDTHNIENIMTGLLRKMKNDGYSKAVISNTIWIINHFKKYCKERSITTVTVPIMAEFLREKYDIDYYNPSSNMQTVLKCGNQILFRTFFRMMKSQIFSWLLAKSII